MIVTRIPKGLRDILPVEAFERRELESRLRGLFTSWGYGEVITPTFEYYDVLSSETGELIQREMFKFFDRDGRAVALRPELTTPIARLTAQRLRGEALPCRLFYISNVFREEQPQRGQQREFYQAGVELIGASDPAADAEVVSLLVTSLRKLGLRRFRIGLGQVEFVRGFIEDQSVPIEVRPLLRDALVDKNLVALEELSHRVPARVGEAIVRLPVLRGEVWDEAADLVIGEQSERALEGLKAVWSILEHTGDIEHLAIDLGIIRNFEYYTGTIFEGYAEGLGFPICGGGRYDNLLGEFGYPQAATGFQLGLERVHIALSEEGNLPAAGETRILVGFQLDPGAMFQVSELLREKGFVALGALEWISVERGAELAKAHGCEWFVLADGPEGDCLLVEATSGRPAKEERVSPGALGGRLS